MKLTDPDPTLLQAATRGDLAALDALLRALQPGVFALAVRFLGNREDGADAAQEILLKVVTHLGSFRGEARFSTWVWRIAHHHLLNAATRAREAPAVSLEAMAERLQQGLDHALHVLGADGPPSLTPQDKLEARQIAIGCTQQMLMCLDRDQRLAYLLDLLLDLDSAQAGEVLGISAAAYRQRLSRARARLDAFSGTRCGLANANAACRCERQLPAMAALQASGAPQPVKLRAIGPDELREAERRLDALTASQADFAALARAHPDYRRPAGWHEAIRAVLERIEPPPRDRH